MKKTIKLLALSLLTLVFVTGCSTERSREEKVSSMISKIDSPFLIVSTTPQNLMDKSGVMDGVLPFTYELILSFFIDEAVTGIDYGTKTQFIVGKGESFIPNTYGIFKIKDETKFIELIEKEANADITEKDGLKYAIKENDGYCVTWNEEFAVIANIPMDLAAMLSGSGGDQGMKMVNISIDMIKAADEGEPNAEFTEFLKNDADVSMYYDGSGFFGYMEEMSMDENADIEGMKDMYEGMSYKMYLNFNDGSIDLSMESDLSEELLADLSFISDKGVDKNLLSYGKSDSPLMYGSYGVDVAGLIDYMKDMMSEREFGRMEDDLAEMGLTMDDAKSALSGQILYIVDSFNQVEETYDYGYGDPYTYTRTEPIFGIVVGISDKKVLEKLFTAPDMDDLMAIETTGEYDPAAELEMMEGGMEMPEFFENGVIKMGDAFIFVQDDVMFMSNDKAWADNIAAGSGVKIKDKHEVTSKNPFGVFVDFIAISKMEDLNDAEPFVNLFVEFYGSANLKEGNFSLVLKDDSKNSLRVLTEVLAEMMDSWERAGQELLEQELEEAVGGFEDLENELDIDIDDVEEVIGDALNELELD